MKINKITFTGVDDETNLKDLIEISNQHPYVEWGILYSEKQSGQGGRYPRRKKIQDVTNHKNKISTAVHLCGRVVKELITKGHLDLEKEIYWNADRVQLNFNARQTKPDIMEFIKGVDYHIIRHKSFKYIHNDHQKVILQVNEANQKFIDVIMEFGNKNDFHFLHDASGGRGEEIKDIIAPTGYYGEYFGYAGGLNPENLEEKIKQIHSIKSETEKIAEDVKEVHHTNVWIDMETGVRTNDVFDLNKVNKCLEIFKKYV